MQELTGKQKYAVTQLSAMKKREIADSALRMIPVPTDYQTWRDIVWGYRGAGGEESTAQTWSANGSNYNEADFRTLWNSWREGGKGAKTLFEMAEPYGFRLADHLPEITGNQQRTSHRAENKSVQSESDTIETPSEMPETMKYTVSQFIEAAASQADRIKEYCTRRGLNEDTISHFRLGFNQQKKTLVIPYPDAVYYSERFLDVEQNSKNGKRYDNLKGASQPVFNIPALYSGDEIVFITEGQIDCMSVYQQGAACIGTKSSKTLFDTLNALKAKKITPTVKVFCIMPDSDEAGQKYAEKWEKELSEKGWLCITKALPEGYHDANDFLVKAGADFWEWLRSSRSAGIALASVEREQYEKNQSASGKMADFMEAIEKRKIARPIKTGFSCLDGENGFDGGLYTGLYVLGAMTSAGKTSFALQIADYIAANGTDVLYFALEMNCNELMSKSISRLTTEVSSDARTWKTALRIMSGDKWEKFSNADLQTVQAAMQLYQSTIAKHLYFRDGLADISVSDIRNAIEKHITITGRKVVAFVDYVQILKAHDPRATDKANLDFNVLELKRISRDNDIPVIAISSFNRDNAGNDANVTAFSGSGALEYTADVCMAIQIEKAGEAGRGAKGDKMSKAENLKYIDEATQGDQRDIELAILKNRHGRKQRFKFTFNCLFNKFEEKHRYSPDEVPSMHRDAPAKKLR